jgi:hypothetical protein
VGDVAVVGHQQEPLGVGVEPTDGTHPRILHAVCLPTYSSM